MVRKGEIEVHVGSILAALSQPDALAVLVSGWNTKALHWFMP